jgi:hypothetical protein
MSWAGLADNEAVSLTNLQDAVDTGVLALKNTIPPASNECITKAEADYLVYINTSKPSYDAKASNQLVVKSDLEAQGGIVYTPSIGLYPLSGSTLVSTSGTIRNNYGINVYLYIGFNSAGLSSGTVSNDSMLIVPLPAVTLSGTITSTGQLIISGTRYILSPSTTYNITLTKGDLLGGGSTLRFYYSLCDLCTRFPV